MAGITLDEARAQLDEWLAASRAVAAGQSFTISTATGSRTLTRADAKAVREMVDFWSAKVADLEPGRRRVVRVRPR